MAEEVRRIYYNPVQLRTQWIGANVSVMVCGRRTGKTEGMAAPFVLKMVTRMPGSTGGIVVPTFLHGLTNTIPGTLAALVKLGYKEGVHYVIGRQPPKWFAEPKIRPTAWTHVIAFWNGSVAVILSQDRAYAANSLTLSWLLIDEAKFIDHHKLKEQTIPANGGIKSFFGGRSCNHAMMILSDMPQSKRGSWFLNYRDEMDPRIIEGIEGLVYEHWRLRKRRDELALRGEAIPDHLERGLRRVDRQLNQLRSVAVYYRECSSLENIELIGERYIRQMKRDLTPLTFRTSILCQRIGTLHDGFYSNFTEDHMYDGSDAVFLDDAWDKLTRGGQSEGDVFGGGWKRDVFGVATPENCGADADVDTDEPLCIGMDYNANINCMVVGQPRGRRLNVVKSFYVKFMRKIVELIGDFCQYYRGHRNKTVIFYYDSTAKGQNFFDNTPDVYGLVTGELERHGWRVIPVYLGNPMRHDEKYRLINLSFTGRNRLVPMVNRENNRDLITALQCAGVSVGRLGFQKDKSGEKERESEEDLLEHRTDITDAFDTLVIGCEKYPQSGGGGIFIPIGL